MTDGVQAAIVARIAEALFARYGDLGDRDAAPFRNAAEDTARAVAGALELEAILSIVEERRNAHSPLILCRCEDCERTGHRYGGCLLCGKGDERLPGDRPWPCDDRKAFDAIHNHLTGGAE